MTSATTLSKPEYNLRSIEPERAVIQFTGDWCSKTGFPENEGDDFSRQLDSLPEIKYISLDVGRVTAWNSALLTCIITLLELCKERKINLDMSTIPGEMTRVIELASIIPERKRIRHTIVNHTFLHKMGMDIIDALSEVGEFIRFWGNTNIAFMHMLRGKAVYRKSDIWLIMQQTGAEALPIVSLLSFLVGAILAYIGATQLEKFGAELYIADMVGLSMTREIGAIITGIIMAGRTGAAFAAQLGTMRANEEIDALKTMGFPPMEYLVLPRILALMLMMPLLVIYANVMGIFGGAVAAVSLLEITLVQYFSQIVKVLTVSDIAAGLIMAFIYGLIVGVVGCQKGMSCGRSAAAVGMSTTSAVVTSVVIIFVSAAALTVIYGALGI